MAVWDLGPNFSGFMMPQGAAAMPVGTPPAIGVQGPAPALPMPRPSGLAAAPMAAPPAPGQSVPMPVPRPDDLAAPAGAPTTDEPSRLDKIGSALSGVKAPGQPEQQRIYSPQVPGPSQNIQQGGLEALVQQMMGRPVGSLGAALRR
jgi:hypothetical protein